MSEPAERSRRGISLPRFQFSLGWLLIVVTIACILLALTSTISGFVEAVFISLLWCVFPTVFLICVVYGRRDYQAFAIGALIPWVLRITVGVPPLSGFFSIGLAIIISSLICGALALATRRWLLR